MDMKYSSLQLLSGGYSNKNLLFSYPSAVLEGVGLAPARARALVNTFHQTGSLTSYRTKGGGLILTLPRVSL